MTNAMRHLTSLAAALLVPIVAASQQPGTSLRVEKDPEAPPPVQRELRGAWIAAVANIDWPSRPGLTVLEQKAELRDILDRLVALRMNAAILHVRPSADALYASDIEPWSGYLTGTQGLAPEPGYDPLAFAVAEAHERGLELHAWFNPYRAMHPAGAPFDTAANHVAKTNPELVRRYGTMLWMDPGDPAVRRRTLAVIADVVRRYDIDAIHIDDYFYPYRIAERGRIVDFPDSATYAAYRRRGGTLSRDDWRRENVNQFVREMYEQTKRLKPHVRVGISPFGIWRPGNPEGIRGFDAYQEIYADARLWIQRGWVDYFAPQLYWHPDSTGQSFDRLLRWWDEQNPHDRHIWPGLFTSRVVPNQNNTQWRGEAVLRQIDMARRDPGASGHIHFSMKTLMQDPDSLMTQLAATRYAEPALPPASPWLDSVPPAIPTGRIVRDSLTGGLRLELRPGGTSTPRLWTVQFQDSTGTWRTRILPAHQRRFTLTRSRREPGPAQVWISAVDRVGNQSRTARVVRP